MAAIEARGLRKAFGSVHALEGLDLDVPEGSVCALLGPNGAGKTTTVRVLATLIRPDAGHARVAGIDVARQPRRVRAVIGLAGQHAAVDDDLTGRENLSDQIVIMEAGRVTTHGSPDALKGALGSRIDVAVTDAADLPAAAAVVRRYAQRAPHLDTGQRRLTAAVAAGAVTLPGLVRDLDAAGVAAEDVSIRRPTLDEVFLDRTGGTRAPGGEPETAT